MTTEKWTKLETNYCATAEGKNFEHEKHFDDEMTEDEIIEEFKEKCQPEYRMGEKIIWNLFQHEKYQSNQLNEYGEKKGKWENFMYDKDENWINIGFQKLNY